MVDPFCFAFIWFRGQGSRSGCAAFFIGRCPKVVFKSPVTPKIRGKESAHMYGVRSFGSVPTCSGWGFSHIERFPPLRMTIRGSGRALIWVICCVFWELAVLYYNTSSSLAKAQDGSTKRCERLCETTRLPPVIPTEVEGSFLQSGKPWVRERRKRKNQGVV